MEEREDLKERMDLAVERIHQIAANPEVEGPAGDYFKRTAQFMELLLEIFWQLLRLIYTGNIERIFLHLILGIGLRLPTPHTPAAVLAVFSVSTTMVSCAAIGAASSKLCVRFSF